MHIINRVLTDVKALIVVFLSYMFVMFFAWRDYGIADLISNATQWNRCFVLANLGKKIEDFSCKCVLLKISICLA